MRIERLISLDLGESPGQGRSAEPGRLVRGRHALGDRPDLVVEVSVRRVMEPYVDALLERARALALHPVEGLAPVVDLGVTELEAFVAYRWIDGPTLGGLHAARALPRARAEALLAALRVVLRRVARGPLGALPAPASLDPQQIIVVDDVPVITDWAVAGAGAPLDVDALVGALGRMLRPPADAVAPTMPPDPGVRAGGFDAALGAALGGLPADEERAPAPEPARAPERPAVAPRTRALAQPAWPAVVAPASTPAPVRLIPEVIPTRTRWPGLLGSGLLGALIAGALVARWSRPPDDPLAPPPVAPPVIAAPVAPPPVVPAPVVPAPVAPPPVVPAPPVIAAPSRPPRAPGPGFLSVRSDVPAAAYCDGRYVGQTPLSRLSLPAGPHHLRLEAIDQPLRLLPGEANVTLAAGKESAIDMKLR